MAKVDPSDMTLPTVGEEGLMVGEEGLMVGEEGVNGR